jgi:integrase/recombinase XerD
MQAEIDRFLDVLQAERRYADNTVAAYRNDLHQLTTFLNDNACGLSWRAVTPDVARAFVNYLWDRGYSAATVARKVSATRSFFDFLLSEHVVPSNPLDPIGTPKVDRSSPDPLPEEAIERLLTLPSEGAPPVRLRNRALLAMLYATGLRASEVAGLDVQDVSVASSSVRCLSRGKERIVPLSAQAREALEAYLSHGRIHLLLDRGEPALFLNQRGERLTRQGVWLLVQEAAEDAGLELKVNHQLLRHTFASHLLSEGVEVGEVQELMGHSSIYTTQAYTLGSESPAAEELDEPAD